MVPPESVPGRMDVLVTVFLVLVNIFNSLTSNIPKADGLTAIEMFMIVNIIFVFCALIGNVSSSNMYFLLVGKFFFPPEYAVILFAQKIKTSQVPKIRKGNMRSKQEVEVRKYSVTTGGPG